jgi:hypothetical protein
MKIEYRVELDTSYDNRNGCDVYIPAIDDFKPHIFSSKERAIEWIAQQNWGTYKIIEVYEP